MSGLNSKYQFLKDFSAMFNWSFIEFSIVSVIWTLVIEFWKLTFGRDLRSYIVHEIFGQKQKNAEKVT